MKINTLKSVYFVSKLSLFWNHNNPGSALANPDVNSFKILAQHQHHSDVLICHCLFSVRWSDSASEIKTKKNLQLLHRRRWSQDPKRAIKWERDGEEKGKGRV